MMFQLGNHLQNIYYDPEDTDDKAKRPSLPGVGSLRGESDRSVMNIILSSRSLDREGDAG